MIKTHQNRLAPQNPFGSVMSGRQFSTGSGYRYGFNAQEKVAELGSDVYTAEFWMYNAQLGRRWNVDPRPHDLESKYSTFLGNPIKHKDPNGAFVIKGSTEGKTREDRRQNRQEKRALRDIVKHAKKEMKTWTDDQWTGIEQITGLSRAEYQEQFVNGKGPELAFTDVSKLSSGDIRNDNRYAHAEGSKRIVLDEAFFNLWKGSESYKKDGMLNYPYLHGGLHFGGEFTGLTKEAYMNRETESFYKFAVIVLGHEATHTARAASTAPPTYEVSWFGTSETGEQFEYIIYGKVMNHSEFGYATYKVMEESKIRPSDIRTWHENGGRSKLNNHWNKLYGKD